MIHYKEARDRLDGIGVQRWETNPPEAGKIAWFNSESEVVAEADYKVILSVGPGARYTMGYNVQSYQSLGIPFVEKTDEGPAVVEDVKTDAEIWERAEAIGSSISAEFVYQCRTLLVAIFNFTEK